MKHGFEAVASAICYSIIRAHFGGSAGEPGPTWNRTVLFVLDQTGRMPDFLRFPLMILTLLFDIYPHSGRPGVFHAMAPERRAACVAGARRSMVGPFRDLMRYFEALTIFSFSSELAAFDKPSESGRLYRSKPIASAATPTPHVTKGAAVTLVRSEIVVIGSGPGGAVTACLLAEAGRQVTLIEAGPALSQTSCAPFTRAEMEQKYRSGGVTTALGRTKVAYIEARCVGGGSEINAGLYHRTPADILDRWRYEYDLKSARYEDMVPHFEACERDVGISYMPGALPAASLKLEEGARRKGWNASEIPRWFKYDPDPAKPGVKQTMQETFIRRAQAAGCALMPDLTVRKFGRDGAGWNVAAESAAAEKRGARYDVRCETLFVAGGAIQTPALLIASGLTETAGRSLGMHPTVKVVARFPERINRRDMGIPVHQVKEFSPRLSFGCSISTPEYLALGLLDHPSAIGGVADDWERMAIYYAMTVGGNGSVRRVPGYDDPLVRYTLTDRDMHDLADGLKKLCELLFAAGAEVLYPSVVGLDPFTSLDDLRRIPDRLPRGRTSLMTVHLFATCPMGEDKSRCTVDSFGRVHGQENLHIADASILCTAPGVNPQGSVMAFARRNAQHFLEQTRH
jgi:choline dehydrogenase-like flavoprotein